MNLLGTEVSLEAWSATQGELTVLLPAWPLGFSVLALAAGATAAALWTGAAIRGGRGSAVGSLAALLVGLLILGVLARFALAPDRSEPLVSGPFTHALGLMAGLAGMGGMAATLGVAAWLGAPVRPGERSAAPLLAAFCTVLTGIASLGSAAHSMWAHALGTLPTLEVAGPLRAHLGTPRTLTPNAQDGWQIEPVTVAPTRPGAFPVSLHARRWGATVRRVVSLEAGRDEPNPALPLRPGAFWRFSRTTERNAQLLWFLSTQSRQDSPGPTLRVVGARVDSGLRVWDVTVELDGTTTPYVLYGWNGETRSFTDQALWVTAEMSSRRDASGLWVRDCTVGGLVGACVCSDAPAGDARALAGPLVCAHSASAPVADSVAAVFVGIVTVGLVLQDPSPAITDSLVASGIAP